MAIFKRMNRKMLFGLTALLVSAMAVLALSACAGENGGKMSGGMTPRSDNLDPQMSWPLSIANYAGQEGKFYLNGQNSGYVTVFDANSQKILKVINVWQYEYDQVAQAGKTLDEKAKDFIQKNALPHHSWILPGGRYNYISNTAKDWDRFWVVDTYSDKIISHMNTGGKGPLHGAFSPFRDLAVFGAAQDKKKGVVTFINTRTHKVIGTVKTTGTNTRDIVFTPDNKYVYVSNSGWDPKAGNMGGVDRVDLDTMKVVDTFKIVGTRAMKMTNDGKLVGSVSIRKGFVAFIDAVNHKIIGQVNVGPKPNNISFSPDSTKAYVGVQGTKDFAVIDIKALKVIARIPGGKNANAVYVSPGNSKIAIATNEGDDFVTVIDTVNNKKIKDIPTPLGAHNVAYTPDGKIAIVSCAKSREAVFIDVEKLEEITVIDKAGHGNNGVRWAPYGPGLSPKHPYGS